MSEGIQITAEDIRRALDEEELRDWVSTSVGTRPRRATWRGSTSSRAITLREDPLLVLALVQTRFATGTHELYQLPLALARRGRRRRRARRVDRAHRRLDRVRRASRADAGARAAAPDRDHRRDHDRRRAVQLPPVRRRRAAARPTTAVRLMGVEQSNSSLVFDDTIVLKVFRKLEPGVNPELEMLRFLTWRGFPNIAPLHGWYDYEGQAFAVDARRGAERSSPTRSAAGSSRSTRSGPHPEMFLERLGSLGTVTARAAHVLASDARDPAFSPEEPSQEALSLLTATIDEDIERIFLRLPDDERLAPIAGRGPGRARAARRARPDRRQRSRDPHPRRLPPRPDAAHAAAAG